MITKVLTGIGKSNMGQRFYRSVCDPKNQNFFNNTLPSLETAIATSIYMWSTQKQDIDERRKHMLQVQNLFSGIVGVAVGSWANRKISEFGEKLTKGLDPKLIPDVHKVIGGIKVGLPIFTTAVLMRCIIPTAIALFSWKVEESRHKDKR